MLLKPIVPWEKNTKTTNARGDRRRQSDHEEVEQVANADTIVDSYRTILTELGVLTTVSVLLFGFLLTSPSNGDLSVAEDWLFFGGMLSIASATLMFVLPIAYHRLQFPYRDWEKFQVRAHTFISVGFPMFLAGLYAALALSLWEMVGAYALLVAAAPLAAVAALFVSRRSISLA